MEPAYPQKPLSTSYLLQECHLLPPQVTWPSSHSPSHPHLHLSILCPCGQFPTHLCAFLSTNQSMCLSIYLYSTNSFLGSYCPTVISYSCEGRSTTPGSGSLAHFLCLQAQGNSAHWGNVHQRPPKVTTVKNQKGLSSTQAKELLSSWFTNRPPYMKVRKTQKKEADYSRLVGGSFNKQGNLQDLSQML